MCAQSVSRSSHALIDVCFFCRGDCCVRIKILVFLLEIFGCLSECSDGNELDDFLHIFLSTITSEVPVCVHALVVLRPQVVAWCKRSLRD